MLPVGFGSGGAFEIASSLRFRSAASAYLSRTFSTPTSSTIYTLSLWVKRGAITGTYRLFGASTTTYLTFDSSDKLNLTLNGVSAATSTAAFRDPAAHYHVVYQQNGSAQTLYVNGVSVATGTTAAAVFNTAIAHQIGAANTTNYFDGLVSEINFVDGQALTPTDFGELNLDNVWVPKAYAGTYGNNGFRLTFGDTASTTTLGYDAAGSNDWTCNNISLTAGITYDAFVDTPAENYATLNPLQKAPSDVSLSAANLEASSSFSGDHRCFGCTFAVSSGKWYWEAKYETGSLSSGSNITGIFNLAFPNTANNRRPADSINQGVAIRQDGQSEINNVNAAYLGASVSVGSIIGVALDADAGEIKFNVNGGAFGSTLTIPSGAGLYTPGGDIRATSGTPKTVHNFGQRPFSYTPPTGYKALSSANMAAVAITNPAQHMDGELHTGNASTQSITSINFQVDLAWIKSRGRSVDHAIYDAVRGVEKRLESNNFDIEVTGDTTGLTAFNSDGWTMGALDQINGTTATNSFVGWAFKANGAGVSNTDGSITSTVSANTAAGIAIVGYAGTGANATVGHGLGAVPEMMIIKNRDDAQHWAIYHAALGATYRMRFTTDAKALSTEFQNTTPTSSVFSIGTELTVNGSGDNIIAYIFRSVEGFSKVGSLVGNASTDGPFINCGFLPKFIMLRNADQSALNWVILDTERDIVNAAGYNLYPNLSAAEDDYRSTYPVDILSNGFKIRANYTNINGSGNTILFLAFAQHPFGGANVSPCPAR